MAATDSISAALLLVLRAKDRSLVRAIRQTAAFRHVLKAEDLHLSCFPAGPLLEAISETLGADRVKSTLANVEKYTEIQCFYVAYLALLVLHDNKMFAQAIVLASSIVALAENRQALSTITARVFFFLVRSHEALGSLADAHSFLVRSHRSAVLRQDTEVGLCLILGTLLIIEVIIALNEGTIHPIELTPTLLSR